MIQCTNKQPLLHQQQYFLHKYLGRPTPSKPPARLSLVKFLEEPVSSVKEYDPLLPVCLKLAGHRIVFHQDNASERAVQLLVGHHEAVKHDVLQDEEMDIRTCQISSATYVQAIVRGYLVRRKCRAATTIQATFRGWVCRLEVATKRSIAAVRLQSMVRRYVCRQRLLYCKIMAIRLQVVIRGYIGRRRFRAKLMNQSFVDCDHASAAFERHVCLLQGRLAKIENDKRIELESIERQKENRMRLIRQECEADVMRASRHPRVQQDKIEKAKRLIALLSSENKRLGRSNTEFYNNMVDLLSQDEGLECHVAHLKRRVTDLRRHTSHVESKNISWTTTAREFQQAVAKCEAAVDTRRLCQHFETNVGQAMRKCMSRIVEHLADNCNQKDLVDHVRELLRSTRKAVRITDV